MVEGGENELTRTNGSSASASTTVLDAGTVESRGFGGDGDQSRDELNEEIESFLRENGLSLATEWRCLLGILIFVTTVPGPVWVKCHPGFLMKGMCYFPVVGTLVGILVALVYDGCRVVLDLPSVVAAAFSMAASFRLTGCLHEDGLADSADGIGGGWDRKQILRIMTDTRLGTFGSSALILYVFSKLELLAALDTSHWEWNLRDDCTGRSLDEWFRACGSQGAGPALVIAHTLARLTAPYLIRANDYVEEDGPKSHFYSFMIRAKFLVSLPRLIFSATYCFVITTVVYGPWVAGTMMVVVLVCSELAGHYGRYHLGGVMGDYLGATICVTEVVVLSCILTQGPMMETLRGWTYAMKEVLTNSASLSAKQALDLFLPRDNQKLQVLVRAVVATAVVQFWRRMVGGKRCDTSVGDAEPPKSLKTAAAPEKVAAQKVLSSSTSSFAEKYSAVQTYMDVLAKPVGSLGTLEEWAARLCALQNTMQPKAEPVGAIIFAGDHGVAASPDDGGEGCSLYPQSVTRAILAGLQSGVAGASVLAKDNATLSVVDVGVVGDSFRGSTVNSAHHKLATGTKNFCLQPAMTTEEMDRCLRMGRESVVQTVDKTSCKVIALGEVGIGNTTTASAMIAALTDQPVETLVGGGAFASRSVDESAVQKKILIVKKALKKHEGKLRDSSAVLCKVGGAEVAALVGAIHEASERNIALLVDGFIVTAAALVAVGMNPNVCRVLFFTTRSAEQGHMVAIERIQSMARDNKLPVPASPGLCMGLRMGEGTAALLAVPILQSASSIVCRMATIQEILAPPE